MYLTYSEYVELGGTLEEAVFENYEFEARTIVDWYTFNRLKRMSSEDYPEELKRCMMRLIQLAKLQADLLAMAMGGGTEYQWGSSSTISDPMIASQSNDGVSISYNVISASEAFGALTSKGRGNEIELTVQRYLNGLTDSLGRNLLYRGVYPDE